MSIPDRKHPHPNIDFTLRDWFNIAGVETDIEIVEEASRLGVTDADKVWDSRRVNELKNGQRLLNRKSALKYIAILRSIAARKHIELFTPERFEYDASLFLSSNACREEYRLPSNQELKHIFQINFHPEHSFETSSINELRRRVQPSPPQQLYGREQDIRLVQDALKNNVVTVIDGIAGDGKTSLAWATTIRVWESRQFTHFDWTTDKRSVVDVYGNLIPIKNSNDEIDFFENILVSLCNQFGWLDLLGVTGQNLVDACADRLRSGRYLIIVDNLESVEHSDRIVRQLLDMLTPIYSNEPRSSRALITSREQVTDTNVGAISIQGIDEAARIPFIRHLENVWQVKRPLSVGQCQKLVDSTDGNPLFMQIAMRRYTLMPTSFDLIIEDIAEGKHRAFDTLFAPLIQKLNKHTLEFASILAYELSLSTDNLTASNLEFLWQSNQYFEDFDYESSIAELIVNRIISWDEIGGCNMHALIRSYLVRMDGKKN